MDSFPEPASSFPSTSRFVVGPLLALESSRIPTASIANAGEAAAPALGRLLADTPHPLIAPRTPHERRAWFHWCGGHQHVFLYWHAIVHACDEVLSAHRGGEPADVARWLYRLDLLIRGSAAAMLNCSLRDPEVYVSLLRPSMKAAREDFSAESAQDFRVSTAAKHDALAAVEGDRILMTDVRVADAVERFHGAERFWLRTHGEVMQSLHRGPSLLQIHVRSLQRDGHRMDYRHYLDSIAHAREASADYDRYFLVERRAAIDLRLYRDMVLRKVLLMHHDLDLLPDVQLAALFAGDGLLVKIPGELLRRAGAPERPASTA
jgi:hypothetical protein